jgi:hypothetical protein
VLYCHDIGEFYVLIRGIYERTREITKEVRKVGIEVIDTYS